MGELVFPVSDRDRDDGTPPYLPVSQSLTVAALDRWLEHAKHGDRVAYHRGFLPLDRCAGNRLGVQSGQELDGVAAALMSMAETGQVHLVQRRYGASDYGYLVVVARSHPVLFARSRTVREFAS